MYEITELMDRISQGLLDVSEPNSYEKEEWNFYNSGSRDGKSTQGKW